MEISSPKLEKTLASAVENGGASFVLGNVEPPVETSELQSTVKEECDHIPDSKFVLEESESGDRVQTKEEANSPRKGSPPFAKLDVDLDDSTENKAISTVSEVESQPEKKFKIDLMYPPLKSSSEREGDSAPVEIVQKMEAAVVMEEEKDRKPGKTGTEEEENKTEVTVKESGLQTTIVSRERILDLQLDLEKPVKDSASNGLSGIKQQQQPKAMKTDPKVENTAQSASVPLPLPVAGWPGGLPSLGYMPPLQAVVSMDGNPGPSTAGQPPHFLLSQPRPKRCSTHCYIARNIYCHQQFTRMMNPFWPAAAGSASLYGGKPYNLNVLPPTETTILGNPLQVCQSGRQDKSPAVTTFSGHSGKDKSCLATNLMDTTQRKQLTIQQASQPAATSNLLHGPAFIFPMSQQQAAGGTAARSGGAGKSGTGTDNASSSSAANSIPGAPVSSSSMTAVAPPTMSFNYSNLPSNEAQYLAILQNNGYPFPIPAHVGAPPSYRGVAHPQTMPFFNGSFYPPQIAHPSQLQHQQQQQQQQQQQKQLLAQSQPVQQGNQNTSTSTGSSSSHKQHQPNQQRLQGAGGGSSNTFAAPMNRTQQQPLRQQNSRILSSHQAEIGGEDLPSTADSRVSQQAQKNAYNQNFAMPIHPQNFALISSASLGGSGSGAQGEKQQQQQPQQQGFRGGVEFIPPHALAMSFASFNGAAAPQSLDFSSMAQNHAIFQSLAAAAQAQAQAQAAAAAAAQQKKTQQNSEEGKMSGDLVCVEEERKAMAGKGAAAAAAAGVRQSFSRPDSSDPSLSASPSPVVSNIVIDGNRVRTTTSTTLPTTATAVTTSSSNFQQQHQFIQLQKQQQMQQQHLAAAAAAAAAAASRGKTSSGSSSIVQSDRLPSSSKFPNVINVFPQGLIQSSPVQSSTWKNTVRTSTSPVPCQSPASTTTSLKNLQQQQGRSLQNHTQISFGSNPRSQGQQMATNNQSPSSPAVIVGSPSAKSAGGGSSPRTTTMTSTGSKVVAGPTVSSQPQTHKHTPTGPSRKSSPVPMGGRNMPPSILGNSHLNTTSSLGSKPQQQQKQSQHQQPAQLFFSNSSYIQAQSPQSTTNTTTATTSSSNSGYYHLRRQVEQQQVSGTTSSGMLSLSPSDPAKALAAAAAATTTTNNNNIKGGLAPQGGLIHATQSSGNPHHLIPAAFPYIHAMPTLPVKPNEQKQTTGA